MNSFKERNKEYSIGMVDVAVQKAHIEASDDEIKVDYMTDAAYSAINGLPYKNPKTGRSSNSYCYLFLITGPATRRYSVGDMP